MERTIPRNTSNFGDELSETDSGYSSDIDEDFYAQFNEQFNRFDCGYIQTPKIFDDFHKAVTEMERTLTNTVLKEITDIHRKQNERKAEGSLISFGGGLLGIAGTVAAPFTGGGSLLLTAASMGVSFGGSSVSSSAETKLTEEINKQWQIFECLEQEHLDRVKRLEPVCASLSEIVEDLQDTFSHLTIRIGVLLKSVQHFKQDESSVYMAQCIMKCFIAFYGVSKTSTHVVRNFEQITQLTLHTRYAKQILNTTKNMVTVTKSMKTCVLRAAIGKSRVTTFVSNQLIASGGQVASSIYEASQVTQATASVSKNVVQSGEQVAFSINKASQVTQATTSVSKNVVQSSRQVVSSIKHTKKASHTIRVTRLAGRSSGRIIKSDAAIQASVKTVTKETTTVTKSVCKAGLALGVVFAGLDLYQYSKAKTASGERCDADKQIRSFIKSIKDHSKAIMDQVETYKQVIKIKKYFEYLLESCQRFVFDEVEMPFEKVLCCLEKIKRLELLLRGV